MSPIYIILYTYRKLGPDSNSIKEWIRFGGRQQWFGFLVYKKKTEVFVYAVLW